MKKIIFVCTGNTCRSPMAEAYAKYFFNDSGYEFASRGISVYYGGTASEYSIGALEKQGIHLSDHTAKEITKEDIDSAYIILTMGQGHKHFLLRKFDYAADKIFTLSEYVWHTEKDIDDPFGQDAATYEKCLEEIMRAVENLKL